ncbi:protein RRP5 homolog [Ostrinia furnacalis]|uniref:protein RRP5 homolog n=1 Tax=Ostrinia furnacalis TaxID=93504 RepID=UPI001039997D|nr:protein RRP5 homolog [Ostrinia furnacalis]
MALRHVQVDEDLADEQVLAKSYPVGSLHRVRVLAYSLSDYTYLVTDQPALLAEKYFTLDQLDVGDFVDGTIKTIADNHMLVDVGRLTGYIPQTHYSDAGLFIDPKKASTSKLPKKFKVGQHIRARVLTVDRPKKGLLLTVKPSLLDEELVVLKSYEEAEVGKAYTGFIRLVREYLLVSFFDNVTALVPRAHVSREPLETLAHAFHLGQIVTCTILKVDAENKKMTGSFTVVPFTPRPKNEKAEKRKQKSGDEVPNKKAKCNDEETDVKDKKKQKKKRADSEADDDKHDMVAKTKKKSKKSKEKSKPEPAEDSDNSEAEDKRSKKKNKKKEQELKSEESDAIETDFHEDSDQVLTPEDKHLIDLSDCDDIKKCKKRIVSLTKNVNARMKRIDRIDQKIVKIETKGLSAKNKRYHTAMHTEKLVVQERIAKLLEALKKAQEKLKELGFDEEENRQNKLDKKKKKEAEVKEEDTTIEPPVKEQKETKEAKKRKKDIKIVESLEPALEVPSAKDFWSADTENLTKNVQEESSSSEEDETEQPKKKRKKRSAAEKLAKLREEEERIRALEQRAATSDQQPRSSDQFERALLASPDCSQLWIAYMAFHLQATEIEKARAVGRRALGAISFREEHERLNVWLALVNTEARFGTKESLQNILQEAVQMNDPFQVHSKVLDIYVETSKQQELCSLVDLMLRKYKRDPGTYTLCGAACFKLGLVEKARQVMQKAISVLEKKEHISVLVQFALLERDSGERERAEALFEQVLAVYPQRVDVCSVYVDMLLKAGDVDHVRQVMERVTSQKLPARKMKILFKKWIEVEEKIGDQEKVEDIRQRAMEYIEKAKF